MAAYDLRIYDVAEGEFDMLERVLRELALPLMPDHGMEPVGFWADKAANRLYQISRHSSLSAVQGNWDRFHADSRWVPGLQERRGERSAVSRVTTTLLTGIQGMPPDDRSLNI